MRYLAFPAIGLLVFLSGCYTTASFYCPSTVNTPLLSEKNQARMTGSIGIGAGENNNVAGTLGLSFAYSPIEHLGIISNFHNFFSSGDVTFASTANSNINNVSRSGELGAGYYTSKGDRTKYIADVYAGLGYGQLKTDGFVTGDMQHIHFFMQPGIGLSNKVVDLAFNIRLGALSYSYFASEYSAVSNYNIYEKLPGNGNLYFFAEPALTFRLGYKFAKFQTQIIVSKINSDWAYDFFVINMGLHFSLEYLYSGYYNKHRGGGISTPQTH